PAWPTWTCGGGETQAVPRGATGAPRWAEGGRPPGATPRGVPGGRPPGQTQRGVPGGRPPGPTLRGPFPGGTPCDAAMVIAAGRGGPFYSNIPLRPEWRIDPGGPTGQGDARHIMIDFGDDELTAGRPHPMIDQRLRLDRLAAEAADLAIAVIMLDVVLGHGAH